MKVFFPILAQPLASDCIGLALLFLVILAWMHHLDALRGHMSARPDGHFPLHDIGHRLHELISPRHQ